MTVNDGHAEEHRQLRDRLTAIETEGKVLRWVVAVGLVAAGVIVAIVK